MLKYKGYDDYKDSGVEWIGEVPKHWLIASLKRFFKIVNGGTPKSNEPLFWEDGNVIWVTPEDLSKNGSMYIEQSKRKISLQGVLNSSTTVVPVNSLIISTRAPIGYIKIAAVSLSTNQGCKCLVRRNTLNEEFYYYFLLTAREELIAFGQGSTFMELSNFNLANTKIVVVPLEEQKQISSYLNIKTSEIDALITDKEKLIELLKEQRQAIISEAVTKGLNPDVKMKDSGVEWIGEVPEHWNIKKIKYTSYVKGRIGWQGLRADEFIDEGPFLITGMHFKDGGIDWDACYHISDERYEQAPEIQVQEGDFLVTKDGTIGKVAYIDILLGKASLNSHLLVIRPTTKEYLSKFLFWLFQSQVFSHYVSLSKAGTTFFGITQKKVEDFLFPCPPLNDQYEITRYLDNSTADIESNIILINKQITALTDYRQSLIYEAVTGKIDVRDWSDKPFERSDTVANA